MKRDGIQLVRSIYRANKAKNKTEYLEQFLDDFEILKLEIRLCADMKILSVKNQAELSGMMESIGKTKFVLKRKAESNNRYQIRLPFGRPLDIITVSHKRSQSEMN